MTDTSRQQLPSGPSTLCFNKEDFMKDDFHVENFVVECRRKVQLEMLRNDLHVYLKILQSAMVELINKDYADFVNLSTNLVGMDKAINNLLNPLGHLKNEILTVRNAMIEASSAVDEKMAYLARIREKKDRLRTLMSMVHSVEKMEQLLGISSCHGAAERTQYSSELNGQLIERVATEFNRLQFYVSKVRGLPLVDELKPRIAGITMTLQYGLEASFREGLSSGNADVLRECLRTYSTIDKTRDAEALFRSCVVKPYMDEIISEQHILQHRSGLHGMYNAVLDFFPKHYTKLREITTGTGQGVVSGYDFVVNAVWPEVVVNIEAKTPSIFAPGNPNVFHEKYTVSIAFVERFEQQCGSQASVKHLRAHTSYSAFMSKWSLSVYFQIRFQEIAGAVETALYTPFAEATEESRPSFLLQCSVQLWQALHRCWESDVFLLPLCHRFWKLTLQLVSRYATWITELQDEASKSFSRPDTGSQGMAKIGSEANIASMSASLTSSTHSASAVNLVMTTSTPALTTKSNSAASAPTITVTNLVSVITDVQTVVAELPDFFTTTVVPLLGHAGNDNIKLLRESMKDSEESLTSQLPQLELYVTNEIVSQCVTNLKAVNDIPRLYRRTNRDIPSKASAYVAGIVRPIVDFLEAHKDMLHEETRKTWVTSIMHAVCEQYLAVTSDVLTSVKKMEESLRRLRTARGTSSAGGSQGMSDDDKIRLQLYLDVKELSTQMGIIGLADKDFESYSRLYQLANSAVQSSAT